MSDPVVVLGLAVMALLYWRGRTGWNGRRSGRRGGRRGWQDGAFAASLAVLYAALASPLDRGVERSLALHMVQHVLLIGAAAPLLALAAPAPALARGLPRRWRAAAMRPARWLARVHRGPRILAWTVTATLIQAAVMWAWHAPVLFEPALRSAPLHALEHLCLLGSATLAWWSLFAVPRSRRGAATLVACLAAFPGTALGAALLLAPRPWYPTYAIAPGALESQQLGGVVMWAFGGFTYLLVAAGLFASWLAEPSGPAAGPPGPAQPALPQGVAAWP